MTRTLVLEALTIVVAVLLQSFLDKTLTLCSRCQTLSQSFLSMDLVGIITLAFSQI